MIEKIKELLKDQNVDLTRTDKNDKELEEYIIHCASEKLLNKNGAIEDKIVIGWAIHYYTEPTNEIDYFIDKEKEAKKEKERLDKVTKQVKHIPAIKKEEPKDDKPKNEQIVFDFGL